MADSEDLQRAKAKYDALLRARLALKQAFERIDYNFDVRKPAKKQLEKDALAGELPEYTVDMGDGS